MHLNGLETLGQRVRWARTEYGVYVPIVKRRYRINARYSVGRDNYKTEEDVFVSSDIAVLPDYYYDQFGFDLSYLVDDKLAIGGSASLLFTANRDTDFTAPKGSRWGMNVTYDVGEHLRLDSRIEAASVSQLNDWNTRAYSDVMAMLESSVQYHF